jgi:hypothetical protein
MIRLVRLVQQKLWLPVEGVGGGVGSLEHRHATWLKSKQSWVTFINIAPGNQLKRSHMKFLQLGLNEADALKSNVIKLFLSVIYGLS